MALCDVAAIGNMARYVAKKFSAMLSSAGELHTRVALAQIAVWRMAAAVLRGIIAMPVGHALVHRKLEPLKVTPTTTTWRMIWNQVAMFTWI